MKCSKRGKKYLAKLIRSLVFHPSVFRHPGAGGGLYVYGLSSGRLGRRHDCADGAGRGTQFFRKSYTGCENVSGRLGICILGAAVIQALGLIPEQTHEILDNFVNKEGFLVFYISALITGSLFNIDRGLLIRATGEAASDSCHIAGGRRDTFRSARHGDGG